MGLSGTGKSLKAQPSGLARDAVCAKCQPVRVVSSFSMPLDTTTLEMALIGYDAERQKIQSKIAELQRQLKIRNHRADAPAISTRRRMSASARKRIAAAQRKRWAAYRKSKKV